jgi:hypothetical protein
VAVVVVAMSVCVGEWVRVTVCLCAH